MDDVRTQAGEQRRVPRGGRDDRPRAGPARHHPPDDGRVDAEHVDLHPRVHLGDEVGQVDLRPTDSARIGAGDDVHQAGRAPDHGGDGPAGCRRSPRRCGGRSPGAPAPPPAAPRRARGRCPSRRARRASARARRPGSSSIQRADPLAGPSPARALSTSRCRSAYAATCGRCVTTTTWCRTASLGQPAADLHRARSASTPAPTSSKTIVGTGSAPASATSSASMTLDSPRRTRLCAAPRRRARVGDEPQLDPVDAVRARDDERIADPRVGSARRTARGVTATSSRASGIASPPSSAVVPGQARRRRGAGRGDRRRVPGQLGGQRRADGRAPARHPRCRGARAACERAPPRRAHRRCRRRTCG